MGETRASSSFKPRGKRRVVQLPGTKISVHNSQLLISTGVPSLDSILGSGAPVGSLLILDEDQGGIYSDIFVKCFLAEGVVMKHKLFLANLNKNPKGIISNLPAPDLKDRGEQHEPSESSSDEMKIAWRYQNLNQVASSSDSIGHNYDIRSRMPEDMLKDYENSFWIPSTDCAYYEDLGKSLYSALDKDKLFTKYNRTEANVMRIVVQSLGSPLWGTEIFSENQQEFKKLTSFLVRLRALARRSFSVILVTLPSHLFTYEPLLEDLHRCGDFVFGFESFEGTEKEVNPVYKEYHGLLHLNKVSPINSLTTCVIEDADWVFKLKRKKLIMEKLHIPPDLSETASRSQSNKDGKQLACSSALDF